MLKQRPANIDQPNQQNTATQNETKDIHKASINQSGKTHETLISSQSVNDPIDRSQRGV
jgi:hypothetical protein